MNGVNRTDKMIGVITKTRLKNGYGAPQKITVKKGWKKELSIMLLQIKISTLNKNSREIIFTNEFNLKQNKFENWAENIMKQVRSLGYKYSLYDWTEFKIIYLASPENIKNSVNEKISEMSPLSNSVIKELELSESIPIT